MHEMATHVRPPHFRCWPGPDIEIEDWYDKGRKCGPCRGCFRTINFSVVRRHPYFLAVRRRRFNNRRASSPNNSVCVGCGKIAFAT